MLPDDPVEDRGLRIPTLASLLGEGVPPGRYLQRTERRQPLMTRPLRDRLTLELTFPGKVTKHRLPKPVEERGAWGTISTRWRSEGNVLTLSRAQEVRTVRIRPASHGPFGKSMAAADRADKAELLLDVEEAVPASAGEEAGAEPAPAPESPADRCAQFNEREASRRRNHQGPCPYCPCSCTDGKVACAPCVACQRDEPLPTPAPAPEPPAR